MSLPLQDIPPVDRYRHTMGEVLHGLNHALTFTRAAAGHVARNDGLCSTTELDCLNQAGDNLQRMIAGAEGIVRAINLRAGGGSSIREECQRIIEDLAIVADAPCINATRRSVLTGAANMLDRLSAAAETKP